MSDINLKKFEFDTRLLENVRLFDEILSEFDEPPLFENPNFRIYKNLDLSTDYAVTYLIMESTNIVKNSLPTRILFEGKDLRIDIDGIPEVFEWTAKHIEDDKNAVLEIIKNLFAGYVLVEIRAASRFVQIFDADGNFINAISHNNILHMITGLYLFRYKNYRKLYLPIISKKK